MNKKCINKVANEMLKDMPWHFATDILQDLNYLNEKGLLHPSHDDTFLWDREIFETEYPKICAEIRADEREKTINEMLEKIREMITGHISRKEK